ncbi:hypothetical protein FE634_11435 [Nocardioides dongxiaopingii]|uniref:hypothetical protein n=1 Tax=Nocardioides sp. S-1144 TaxID=2582905 RepID=UPI00110EDE30|nr:hypothetical protein [Nocardioides sp. S-1144]QCW50865.1 hypothetical protein FE634_11435 [Nocardioides sp. S-1144]
MKLRTTGLAATPVAALALALAVTGSTPATAAPTAGRDLPAASSSSAWLASRLVDGLAPGPFGPRPDYGLSIDAIYALHASGDGELAEPILTALDDEGMAANFYSAVEWDAERGLEEHLAGPTAKTLVAAQVGGRDPRDFGGQDLVARTLSTVVTAADVAPGGRFAAGGEFEDGGVAASDVGRVVDFGPDVTYNNANSFGQTLAVIGLARAGRLTGPVVDKLLWQRCGAGFFRIFYDGPRSCDESASAAPDRDATGLGLSAMLAAQRSGVGGLDDEIAGTVGWLLDEQDAGGGWGGGVGTEAPNTNSTGLVVQALADAGAPVTAVADGEAYLASAQVGAGDVGTALAGDVGAIAYTPAAREAARADGIDQPDTWIRATAQASLGLSQVGFWELTAPRPARFAVTAPTGYVLRGRSIAVRATGLAAGEAYRVTVGGRSAATGTASADGVVATTVVVPSATAPGTRAVAVTGATSERTGAGSIRVLAAKKLAVRLRAARLRPGAQQRITVRGLAAGEAVTLRVRGKVLRGRATAAGVLTRTVRVARPFGAARVRATGAFAVRSGAVTFRVVRR